jgi:hypothetical protein
MNWRSEVFFMENMMIELRNLRKDFGDVRVVNGGGFCLEKGFVKSYESNVELKGGKKLCE